MSTEEFPAQIGQPKCQYFLRTGTCKFGAACKFHHPWPNKDGMPKEEVLLNLAGLPMRLGEPECTYYTRTGSCRFGLKCKFHHPQPGAPSSTLPSTQSSPSVYTPAGTAMQAGTGPDRWGTTWIMAGASYLPGFRAPTPASFRPVLLIPQWTTPYKGPASPAAFTKITGQIPRSANPPASPRALTHNSSGSMQEFYGQSYGSTVTTEASHDNDLPERVGEPDCHYYLKTGACKFGSSCKFHHPRDRTASFTSGNLNAIGLPLRPGQPLCNFYIRCGMCRYGPVCKFDHPLGELTYDTAPSLSSPSLSVFSSREACSSTTAKMQCFAGDQDSPRAASADEDSATAVLEDSTECGEREKG